MCNLHIIIPPSPTPSLPDWYRLGGKQLLFNVLLTSLLTKLRKIFFYMSGRKVSLESSFEKVPIESRLKLLSSMNTE